MKVRLQWLQSHGWYWSVSPLFNRMKGPMPCPCRFALFFYFNAQKLTPYSFSGFQLSTGGWPILKVWLIISPLPTPPPLRAKGIWQMWWSWCALEFWRDRVTLISDDICKLSNAVSTDKSRSFRLVPQWRVARYPGTKSSAWIVGKNSNWNPL